MPHVFSNKAFLGPLLTHMYLLWSIKLSIYLSKQYTGQPRGCQTITAWADEWHMEGWTMIGQVDRWLAKVMSHLTQLESAKLGSSDCCFWDPIRARHHRRDSQSSVAGPAYSCDSLAHGGDWERTRSQGPKNVHNFLMTVRPLSWAYGHETEMLLILKKTIFDLIIPWYIQIWQSKEMSRDFVRGQSVA